MQETSVAALESIRRNLSAQCETVYRMFLFMGTCEQMDATCEEAELWLGMKHQTVSARICDLRKKGMIEDSGVRRKTRSGRNAIAWRVT